MKFKTKLGLAGKTATGFVVPAAVVESLGAGKRPPVRVTINGYMYRNTVAVMGGQYMLGVAAGHRERAGVEAGDTLEVELELDTAPREIVVPEDFAEALGAEPRAKAFFEGLSYSERRWFVLNIESAKAAETRQRRIAAAVERLAEGRGQR